MFIHNITKCGLLSFLCFRLTSTTLPTTTSPTSPLYLLVKNKAMNRFYVCSIVITNERSYMQHRGVNNGEKWSTVISQEDNRCGFLLLIQQLIFIKTLVYVQSDLYSLQKCKQLFLIPCAPSLCMHIHFMEFWTSTNIRSTALGIKLNFKLNSSFDELCY